MFDLTKGQKTQVRLGCIAAILLPLLCKNRLIAYAHALHAKLAETHGDKYSRSDVSRALKLLVAHNVLVAEVEDETKPRSRVYYRPTWLAGFYMATLSPMWDWPDFC